MEASAQPHKRFFCSFPACSAAYNKQWKLDAHVCKHTGVRPHGCDAPGCGKSFTTRHHLDRHRLVHSGARPFPCTEPGCAEAFTTNANRTRHVARAHAPHSPDQQQQQHRKYVCRFDGCGLEFRKNKQLRAHQCEQHPGGGAKEDAQPHRCAHPGCDMTFPSPSKLKRHEKVHRGYPCTEDGCAVRAKTWTELLAHRKEHRQRLPCAECAHCGKTFRDAWFLRQHERVHGDTRLVLVCPHHACDRSFTTVFNLQSHVRSCHEERRPFACAHAGCAKTFAMKQSLRRHSVAHDPDRKKMEGKKARPRRSLASRLSGHKDAAVRRKKPVEKPGSGGTGGLGVAGGPGVELASLLQDTSLLCGAAVDSRELTGVLTAPLAV